MEVCIMGAHDGQPVNIPAPDTGAKCGSRSETRAN